MAHFLWLIPLGFIVGAYGTLIGAGGGFVLVPLLLLFYPKDTPQIITSISLAVVFFNTLSGSVSYARMKLVDFRSGGLFAVATIPGAILGALSIAYIPRRPFDIIFGVLLVVVAAYLILATREKQKVGKKINRGVTRNLVTADGRTHTFSYNPRLGVGLSLFVGYFSSLLGIGGGIIHVPILSQVLNFPVHVATATSHFILAIMALTGTLVHIATGAFHHGVRRAVALGIGALLGAPVGAWLSRRLHGYWIIRGLAIALGFVGIRILIGAL